MKKRSLNGTVLGEVIILLIGLVIVFGVVKVLRQPTPEEARAALEAKQLKELQARAESVERDAEKWVSKNYLEASLIGMGRLFVVKKTMWQAAQMKGRNAFNASVALVFFIKLDQMKFSQAYTMDDFVNHLRYTEQMGAFEVGQVLYDAGVNTETVNAIEEKMMR